MTVDDKTLDRINARTHDEVLKVLNAKVQALWQLGEPRDKTKMPVRGNIPVITDIEKGVAQEAVQAVAEKYGIKKHDLYMFQRAMLMDLYHGLGLGCPLRVELAPDIDGKINWQ